MSDDKEFWLDNHKPVIYVQMTVPEHLKKEIERLIRQDAVARATGDVVRY